MRAEIFTWPDELIPDQMSFYPEYNTGISESPFTRQTQVIYRVGVRWRAELQFSYLNDSKSRKLDALLSRMRGTVNLVRLWDFRRPRPRGTARTKNTFTTTWSFTDQTTFSDGTNFIEKGFPFPQTMTPSDTGDTITTEGWEPNQSKLFDVGDYISLDPDRLHMITEQVSSDGNGQATLKIAPPIERRVVQDRTRIKFEPAYGLFRLIDNRQNRNQTKYPIIGTYNIQLVQVI